MEKAHFEILLEEMKSNFQLAFEGLDGVNGRLDKVDGRLDNVEGRLDNIEGRLGHVEAGQAAIKADVGETRQRAERLEAGQAVIKADVRDAKRNTGLFNSVANDHESRLQGVESSLRDHLENHS